MRPRPLGRGERRDHVAAPLAIPCASMRPRPLGRGEPDAPSPRRKRPRRGFNAATASRPWRTSRQAGIDSTACRLQCGHGLSAVENLTQRVWTIDEVKGLQCGHGLSAVENASRRRAGSGSRRASMRPRPLGRGEPGPAEAAEPAATAASMRPRPLGRGEPLAPRLRRGVPVGLQCGHGLSAVENRVRRRRRLSVPTGLQCGHGLSAVENNEVGEPSSTGAVLQCGHGLSAVENLAHLRGHGVAGQASMRPRPLGRGERHLRKEYLTCDSRGFNAATASRPWRTRRQVGLDHRHVLGFNAATASRPWRTVDKDESAVDEDEASMRPRPLGRGEQQPRRPGIRRPAAASMRPRPLGRGEPARRSPRRAFSMSFNAATASRPWRTPVPCVSGEPA